MGKLLRKWEPLFLLLYYKTLLVISTHLTINKPGDRSMQFRATDVARMKGKHHFYEYLLIEGALKGFSLMSPNIFLIDNLPFK